MQVVAVLKVLWDVSPQLVLFIIFYSAAGTIVTLTGFGAPLMRLFEEALHREVLQCRFKPRNPSDSARIAPPDGALTVINPTLLLLISGPQVKDAFILPQGDLRFTLVRVAENAESIAFYGGASREESTVRLKFCFIL